MVRGSESRAAAPHATLRDWLEWDWFCSACTIPRWRLVLRCLQCWFESYAGCCHGLRYGRLSSLVASASPVTTFFAGS